MVKYVGYMMIFMTLLSCNSFTGRREDPFKSAQMKFDSIVKAAKNGDVEKMLEDFISEIDDLGYRIEDFSTSEGAEVTVEYLNKILKDGWQNELKSAGNELFNNLKDIDNEKMGEYLTIIREMSDKLSINLLQLTGILIDYFKETSVEISKTELLSVLKELF